MPTVFFSPLILHFLEESWFELWSIRSGQLILCESGYCWKTFFGHYQNKKKACITKIIPFWPSINMSWRVPLVTGLSEDEWHKLSHQVASFVAHCKHVYRVSISQTGFSPVCWMCSLCSHTQCWQHLKPDILFQALRFRRNPKLSVGFLKYVRKGRARLLSG